MRILFVGDVVAAAGRRALKHGLRALRGSLNPDLIVVNGENAARGNGLTPSCCDEIFRAGAEVITSGNHIWDKRELIPQLDGEPRILRPLNYGSVPGHGWGTFHAADGTEVAVVNAHGRSTMIPIDNPIKVRVHQS